MSSSDPSVASEPIPDRRTRQRERRRDSLYLTAVELFVEKGFDNTTMEDIADRADVSRATVFNYFPRKNAFVDEWSVRRRQRAFAALAPEDREGAPLRAVLTRYFTELGHISTDSRLETVALMDAAVHSTNVLGRPELGVELSRFIEHARDNDEIDRLADSQRVGMLLASAYFAVLTAWIGEDPAPFDLTSELLASLDILLNGILPRS